MAGFNCTCGTGGIGNLGLPPCNDLLQVVARLVIVPTYDDDGAKNSIKSTDFVDGKLPDGYINSKLIEADASKRWYVTDKFFDEVEISNTDRTTQTTSSGAMYELLQGVVTFTGKLFKRPPSYKGQLNSAKCGENSVFFVDTTGRLMGEVSTDGTELFPLEMQEGSIIAEYFPKSDSSESYVSFDFQLDRVVSSENFLTIPAANIEENLKKSESLIDITIAEPTPQESSTASVVFTANYALFGTFGNMGTLEGKVGVDGSDANWWTVTVNGSTGSIASVTEDDGKYTITPTAPFTSTDTVVVKYEENRTKSTAKGFESNSLTITIP